jgi:hypothetical protein
MEMALVLPLLIALVMNFVAVMVVVRVKAEVTAATSLGAQAAISAPVGDIQDSCGYAADTFFSTLYSRLGTYNGTCPRNGAPQFAAANPVPRGMPIGGANVTLACQPSVPGGPNYFTGDGYFGAATATAGAPVRCTSSVAVDFNRTPLGFAVFWRPVLNVSAQAYPSSVRQKCPNAQCR